MKLFDTIAASSASRQWAFGPEYLLGYCCTTTFTCTSQRPSSLETESLFASHRFQSISPQLFAVEEELMSFGQVPPTTLDCFIGVLLGEAVFALGNYSCTSRILSISGLCFHARVKQHKLPAHYRILETKISFPPPWPSESKPLVEHYFPTTGIISLIAF